MSRPIGSNKYHGRGVGGYGPPPTDYGRGGSYYQQPSNYGRGGYYQQPSYGIGGYYHQPSGYTGGSFNQPESNFGGGGFYKNPINQSYQSPMMNYNRPGEQSSNDNINYYIPHEHQITTEDFPMEKQCDMCKLNGDDSFCYSCNICKFNICSNCYDNLIKYFTQILHPHQLFLTCRKNKTCGNCYVKDQKLFIECKEGDFDCCVYCFIDRSDEKVEPKCSAQ